LTKWAIVEHELGNKARAQQYETFAGKLKGSFNKSTKEGGFWDEEKKCYVHWLDKDKSVHGRNMVTPVNFMAIAYGICDNEDRTKTILDNLEAQMQKEKLFFWPLTVSSYEPGEGRETQYPFPSYENGEIFLSWGAVAVKAYAGYKPELALKYVRNVMERHSKDGLAFQRYGREKQDGLGDDILSGNSLSVVGLYQAIYGIDPMFNRFYLNPHITMQLSGTELQYNYQGQKLTIGLVMDKYSVSNNKHTIISNKDFGFFSSGNQLSYFDAGNATASMMIKTEADCKLTINIKNWSSDLVEFNQTSSENKKQKRAFTVNQLAPNALYTISSNGKRQAPVKTDAAGSLVFNYTNDAAANNIVIAINK
jgi:hypothetical protein